MSPHHGHPDREKMDLYARNRLESNVVASTSGLRDNRCTRRRGAAQTPYPGTLGVHADNAGEIVASTASRARARGTQLACQRML